MPKSSINNRVTRSSIRGQIPPFRGHNLLWRSKTPGRDVPKHDPQRLVGMKASFAGEIKNAMANLAYAPTTRSTASKGTSRLAAKL
jgi:hypothetical protein